MSNKLEECARALCILDGIDPDDCWAANDLPGEIAIPAWRQARYIDRTRAVIRCLMEPSEEIISASIDGDIIQDTELARMAMTRAFRAMLQSVLDEAGEK